MVDKNFKPMIDGLTHLKGLVNLDINDSSENGPFVIMSTNDEDEVKYLGYDSQSGGYPYWSNHIGDAILFKTVYEAITKLEGEFFIRTNLMMDGTNYPPVLIHNAIGLNNNKQLGSATISIALIVLESFGDIKLNNIPLMLSTDQELIRKHALAKLTDAERKALGLK